MSNENILKKLNRKELLEMLYEQSRKLDEKDAQIEKMKAQLNGRAVIVKESGSIADAALELNNIFATAQNAADLYVDSVKYCADKGMPSNTNLETLQRCMRISRLYMDKVRKSLAGLDKELGELEKLLRIMEVNS